MFTKKAFFLDRSPNSPRCSLSAVLFTNCRGLVTKLKTAVPDLTYFTSDLRPYGSTGVFSAAFLAVSLYEGLHGTLVVNVRQEAAQK